MIGIIHEHVRYTVASLKWWLNQADDVTVNVTKAILTININTMILCILLAAAFVISCWSQRIKKLYHKHIVI